eukprot:11069253-Alexandrium_andersonii.AAC.1
MGGLREGRAMLEKSPLAAVSRPVATVERLVGKPGAGLLGVLGEPESEVGLLPGRFGAQPPGKP